MDGEIKHGIVRASVGVYVSSKGRLFIRTGRVSRGSAGLGSSRDPTGGTVKTPNSGYQPSFRFEGRALYGVTQFESGARQMTVRFDDSFRTCSANVVYGKEGSMPGVVLHGMSTRLLLLKSVKISSETCSIIEGNMFGGTEGAQWLRSARDDPRYFADRERPSIRKTRAATSPLIRAT